MSTKIKMCGLKRPSDIEYANEIKPSHIGFVFAENRKRTVTPEYALELRKMLSDDIIPVGVFLNNQVELVISLVKNGVIDAVQLHGNEDEEYIAEIRRHTDCTIIKAFKIRSENDTAAANSSSADMVLLDSGEGSGKLFDHSLLAGIKRPYFLAGGLDAENVFSAVKELRPYGVDTSSSLETDGFKDKNKMAAFADAVRKADKEND